MKIALGADHAGYELKDQIKLHLQQQGIEVRDEGTSSPESVDYPDYARAVAHDVSEQRADLGILVCGSGIGMAITANKVDGIRAANVSTEYEAQMSREHNNANVLALGARISTPTRLFASSINGWLLRLPVAGMSGAWKRSWPLRRKKTSRERRMMQPVPRGRADASFLGKG